MKSGQLHIRKVTQEANWKKQGYGEMAILPKAYTSQLLPFYFRHLAGSGSPGEGAGCDSFVLEKLKPTNIELVETTISLDESNITHTETGDVILYYFSGEVVSSLGYISAGIYRYKIRTFDFKTYYSEPFQIMFDYTGSSGITGGDFSNDFNEDFWI